MVRCVVEASKIRCRQDWATVADTGEKFARRFSVDLNMPARVHVMTRLH